MARKVRVEFEGAIYYVMCRGDRRENVSRMMQILQAARDGGS